MNVMRRFCHLRLGYGDPAGVNERAIAELKNTALAAQKFAVEVVNGFTGSSICIPIRSLPCHR